MPYQTDLNDVDGLFNAQNQQQLSKLNVYFCLNQVAFIQQHQVWGMLFGDKPWQPNMGPTMQGVRMEPTPKTRTFFRPNSVQVRANKDVADQRENQERASIFWHKFESPLIYWLRNWQDFIANQIRPAMADLNEQVEFANERFIETLLWDRVTTVYVAGVGTVEAPGSGPPAYTANPKTAAWLAGQLATVTESMSLAILDNAYITLREENRAAPFEGTNSFKAKDNEVISGKYLWLTSAEAYSQLKWDPAWPRFRDVNTDYVGTKFMGTPLGELVARGLSSPFRFDANGVAQAPEILIEASGETVPNPNYSKIANAPFELNWILGADVLSSIKIGPPPKEFSGGASARQVNGMTWNGKVNLTDRFLVKSTDSTGTAQYEYNSYGEYLRAQATLTMGALPGRPRNAMAVLFARKRVSSAP